MKRVYMEISGKETVNSHPQYPGVKSARHIELLSSVGFQFPPGLLCAVMGDCGVVWVTVGGWVIVGGVWVTVGCCG